MIGKEIKIEELKENLIEGLKTLEPIEQKVLDLIYGLSSGRKTSIEEAAKELNLSIDEATNIHINALRKMRRSKISTEKN